MGDGGGSSADGLLELGPTGQAASGSPFLSGSSTPVNAPETVAVDTVGNIWLANNGSSKNDLISFPGTGSSYTAHTATSGCLPEAMAIDGSNNAYFACSGVTNLFKFANTGTVGSPSYGSTATQYGAVGSTPYGVAVDTTGNVWVGSYGSSTISEFPVGFTTSTTPTTYGLSASPYNVAVDNSGNIWSVSSSTLFELLKSGTSYSVNSFTGGGLNSARALAIDGGNDIWVANEATTAISGTTYVSVSEFTDSGTAITVENYEDLPGGYPKALPSSVGTPYMRSLAIDPSGNVWVAGCGLSTSCNTGANSFVLEIVGAATPPVVPLSTAIANDELGCCSFTPTAPGGTPPTSAGYLTLQASSYSPMRDSGSLSFLVTRNGGSTGTVSVSYATSNGTATAGTDYTSTSGTLSWASGNTTSQTITVPWLNTSSYTGSKTFTLTLSSATGGASITPYTSTAVSVSTQVTSSVISANTYPFFANAGNGTNTAPSASVPFYITPPSTYFTLGGTNYTWKLQDPIDIYGGTGGTNGSQFQDEQVTSLSGYSSPYFYLNTNNQMVFSAPSNGAVTEAPGSNGATRSELREEFTGTNNDGSGDWYAYKNNGTITGGTMTGTCKVISVSAGSDETTFAQIHAVGANPFTLLIVKPSNGDVEIRMVNTSANLSSTYAQIIPAYTLGDTISYSLSYSAPSSTSAGTLTVQATDTTTGSTSGQVTLSVDSSWSPIAEYFKLGAYQGGLNTGNLSSAYSQTVYTTWSITH